MHYLPLLILVAFIIVWVNVWEHQNTTPEERRADAMDEDGDGTHVW